jgi:hypothetical protein
VVLLGTWQLDWLLQYFERLPENPERYGPNDVLALVFEKISPCEVQLRDAPSYWHRQYLSEQFFRALIDLEVLSPSEEIFPLFPRLAVPTGIT